MAALFKVSRHDKPTERKMIKAETINELISAAKIKLQLAHEKYKVYTDDFTDIDEDEILMELAKAKASKAEQLVLTLVPDDISWNNDALQNNTSTPSTGKINEMISSSPSTSYQADREKVSSAFSRIFPKLSTNIQSALQNGKSLEPRERRSMIQTVVEYIIHDLKDTSRKTAETLSQQIVKAFPKTFIAKIGNKNIDGEIEALRQMIHYAVHYKKEQSANTRKRPFSCLDESEEGSIEKPKAQDEYGCVAYLPILPASETLDSQEDKRLRLQECSKSSQDLINDDALILMRESYYLQRREIHKDKNLTNVFEHWPWFHRDKIIIQHADQLLGQKNEKLWKESLNSLAKPINSWSKNAEIYREIQGSKKKGTQEGKKIVRHTLKTAKAYCEMLGNDEPYHCVVFALIALFMKEDVKYLYILINEEVTNNDLLQHVPVLNPVLIIRGKDLHCSENVYDVVIDQKVVIHAQSFLSGLLTTFLSYYVFGVAYPKEIEGTLETIQRLFLKICPPKGTKRSGKRKATIQHPKITKMTQELESYIDDNDSN